MKSELKIGVNMQLRKMRSIFGYFAWLIKKYNELKQVQEDNIYRIIEIIALSNGQSKIVVQVVGKLSIMQCSPQEIVANDSFLEGFSKKDVRTITYLACQQIKMPNYKIIMQDFCEKFNRIIFKLKEIKSGLFVVKTASQIVADIDIVKSLSQEDINCISYIAGYECAQVKDV